MEGEYSSGNYDNYDASTLGGKVTLVNHFRRVNDVSRTKFHLDGYLIIIVLGGELRITIDRKEFHLCPGDLFSCFPRNMLEHLSATEDFDARMIYLSTEFAESIASKVHIDWTFGMMVKRHEILHADVDDLRLLQRYFDLTKDKLDAMDSEYKSHTVEMLFASMLYEMFDIRTKAGVKLPPMMQYSAAENLLQRFVKLLNEPGHGMRSVNEYAASLCVSSKYFSSVCKQLTGKSASALINEEIIRSAKMMLAEEGQSLKQIADALHFKNQSHFGTFFRRHVGMSPQHFRDACRGKKD